MKFKSVSYSEELARRSDNRYASSNNEKRSPINELVGEKVTFEELLHECRAKRGLV